MKLSLKFTKGVTMNVMPEATGGLPCLLLLLQGKKLFAE
jgi:hypothetical protein